MLEQCNKLVQEYTRTQIICVKAYNIYQLVPRLDTSLYQSGCIKAATLSSMNQIRIITWNKQGKNFSAQQKKTDMF
jgi:hypothetical protein